MAKNVYERVKEKTTNLKNKRAAQIAQFEERINALEVQIDKLEDLSLEVPADEFVRSSFEADELKRTIALLRDRIHQIEASAVISDNEYTQDVKEIRAEQKRITTDMLTTITKKVNEILTMYDDGFDKIRAGDTVLKDYTLLLGKDTSNCFFNDNDLLFLRAYIGDLGSRLRANPKYGHLFE